jgi:hypothetical protein
MHAGSKAGRTDAGARRPTARGRGDGEGPRIRVEAGRSLEGRYGLEEKEDGVKAGQGPESESGGRRKEGREGHDEAQGAGRSRVGPSAA